MTAFLETLGSFVLVLGILIFVHEFGHFLFAKAFGIGVPVFSLGVGPRLIGVTRGGTEYRISLIPLGGYVRMAGDEEDEDRAGRPEELGAHPKWQRFLVFLAGALFNILLALVITWLVLWVYGKEETPKATEYPVVASVQEGSPVAEAGIEPGDRVLRIAGKDARDPQTQFNEILMSPGTVKQVEIRRDGHTFTVKMNTGSDPRYRLGDPGWRLALNIPVPPTLVRVVPGYPAVEAGLKAGDRILGADGKEPIGEADLLALLASSPGLPLRLVVDRGGRRMEISVTPRREKDGRGRIGADISSFIVRKLTAGQAVVESLRANLELSKTLFLTLRKLIRGDISVRAFSGPIEIARVSRQAIRGMKVFLAFLAFISLQLGILNLLPIPVLDGGHILILAVEAVIRRDLSERLKERVMQAGMIFLLAFFGVVIYFDVIKTWFVS